MCTIAATRIGSSNELQLKLTLLRSTQELFVKKAQQITNLNKSQLIQRHSPTHADQEELFIHCCPPSRNHHTIYSPETCFSNCLD